MANTATAEVPAWKVQADQRTKELTEKLENGIKDLFTSDKYKDYLKSMSHFHNYSSRNIMLIHQQMPGATRVASYKLWKEQFKRQVKKGEEGLRIYAPVGSKKPETKLMEKLDPETGAPMLDENGKVIMEEMTALNSRGIGFKLVPVFDISQTYGEPLPQLAEDLTGNVAHYEAFLDALKAISPLPIEFEPLRPEQDGYCRFGEKIGIREGMSEIQTVSAIIHEIAHARLHDRDLLAANEKPKSKEVKEIEAESVSFVVCGKYGIETGANSFGYLASWGSHDMSEFKASLDTIRKESNSLINAVDDRFRLICKERGIDLTAQEAEQPQQAATAENTQATPTTPEKQYTTESTTQNIAGVEFTVNEVVPETDVSMQTAAEHDPIYEFVSDYYQYILDAYRNGIPRDAPDVVKSDISGLADILRNGKTGNFREAIERAGNNSNTQERAAALLQRLDEMFPNTAHEVVPSTREHRNFQQLMELFPQITSGEFFYQHFETSKNDNSLAVEWTDENKLTLSMKFDPVLVMEVDREAKTAAAIELQQVHPPLHHTVDKNGDGYSIDVNGNESRVYNLQAELNDFTVQFLSHIKQQDFVPVLAALRDSEDIDPSVYFNADRKAFNLGFMYESEGTTIFNRLDKTDLTAENSVGGMAKIAYVDSSRNVEFFEENLPKDVVMIVENVKLTNERTEPDKQAHTETNTPPTQTEPPTPPPPSEPPQTQEPTEPMPDPTISIADMEAYGYTAEDMLPLNHDRAIDLFNQDHTIFLLFNDGTESMVFDSSEITDHDGIFGIERDDWQKSAEYSELTAEAVQPPQKSEAEKEADFINAYGNAFAIYQVKNGDEYRDVRFAGMEELEKAGLEIDRANYELVYTAPLNDQRIEFLTDRYPALNNIYRTFNVEHPEDYTGRSVSMSDVVLLKHNGDITSFFVDSAGFMEIDAFLGKDKQQEYTAPAVVQSDTAAKGIPPVQTPPPNEPPQPPNKPPSIEMPDIPRKDEPVYMFSADDALKRGEIEAFHQSRKLNVECGNAIDRAVIASNYEEHRYDLKSAAREVIEKYGADRVAWVLASNVNHHDFDGRLSNASKDWAKGFDTPKPDVHLQSHMILIEGFVDNFRKVEKEKPSLMTAIAAGEKKSKAEFGGNTQPGIDAPDKSTRKNNDER